MTAPLKIPLQLPQAMESNKNLLFILAALVMNRLCSLLPAYVFFDPFPFYDIMYNGQNVGISLQSYIYFIGNHLMIIFIWLFCLTELPKFRGILYWFFILEIFSLIDFFLIYEKPWFHLLGYGVEFTDFKLILYAYAILKWRQQ